MRFRPCIDLHHGVVKQIVGGTLRNDSDSAVRTNFVSNQLPSYYANLYCRDRLYGGHVIMLGPGNEAAAQDALRGWPGGMQIGGGINPDNAMTWLDRGASAVIVTSWVFQDGWVDWTRLSEMAALVGRERLVLDLSCRKREDRYWIVTNRWQKFTRTAISPEVLADLAAFCGEFLVHAADVEGLCQGIEEVLVEDLGLWAPIPITYAGGIQSMEDVHKIRTLGRGRLDFTVGSALDLFGGTGVKYEELVVLTNSDE